jgi:hypothetical protein
MNKKLKTFLIIVAISIVVGIGYGLYEWYKPHRDVKDETALKASAQEMFDAYKKDEPAANTLYLNKAIEVSGEVARVKTNQAGFTVVYLKTSDPIFGVNCTFKENPGTVNKGDQIKFKGICTGFLEDVIIMDGYLIK